MLIKGHTQTFLEMPKFCLKFEARPVNLLLPFNPWYVVGLFCTTGNRQFYSCVFSCQWSLNESEAGVDLV